MKMHYSDFFYKQEKYLIKFIFLTKYCEIYFDIALNLLRRSNSYLREKSAPELQNTQLIVQNTC